MIKIKREVEYDTETNKTGVNLEVTVKAEADSPIPIIIQLEKVLCQVRETLEALEAKQKTWEAKVANQVDQPEPEHSTLSNDPKLPEKEQSQRIRNRSKQYIISYPHGATICKVTGHSLDNSELSERLLAGLKAGKDVTMPDTWKVQVVNL